MKTTVGIRRTMDLSTALMTTVRIGPTTAVMLIVDNMQVAEPSTTVVLRPRTMDPSMIISNILGREAGRDEG